jgi:hypothetical protein
MPLTTEFGDLDRTNGQPPQGMRTGERPADEFRFFRVRGSDEVLWHVSERSRFLGTIAEDGSRYAAMRLVGRVRLTRRFNTRDAAARWLAKHAMRK